MKLNQDYTQRVRIESIPVLQKETRVLLESDGGECAATTSIVRYDAGDMLDFSSLHLDTEIMVLEGSIEGNDELYPAGTYLRHAADMRMNFSTHEGCLLFLKQRAIHEPDAVYTVHRTYELPWHPGMVGGLSVMPLPSYGAGNSALVKWAPDTIFNPHRHWGGEEILVLEGVFRDDHGEYPKGTWIRSPHLSEHAPFTGAEGAVIFVKTGHL